MWEAVKAFAPLIIPVTGLLGLVLGFLKLGFDFLKWRNSRARLCITAEPNWALAYKGSLGNFALLKVKNTGGKKITLKALKIRYYPNLPSLIMRKSRGDFEVPILESGPRSGRQQNPELGSGDTWEEGIISLTEIEVKKPKGWVRAGVKHSEAAKPVYKRFKVVEYVNSKKE